MKLYNFLLLSFLVLGLSSCGGQQQIVSGLSENDANQVIVVLQSQDIEATKVLVAGRVVTYALSVSSSDAKEALKILVDNKLPKVQSPGLAEIYPAGGGGLIPSATQEKAQFLMALQGEIENMLLVLPGIVQARVVIVLPDASLIREPGSPPLQSTASVAVVYNPADDEGNPAVSADNIKYLIASAIPDLSPSGVTVVMASNFPMKLIDAKKTKAKSVVSGLKKPTKSDETTAPPVAGPTQAPPPEVPKTNGTNGLVVKLAPEADKITTDKHEFLITLFGALAAIGLLLGVFGLVRSILLRARLTRMEKAVTGEPPATQVSSGAPSSEATVGAGE